MKHGWITAGVLALAVVCYALGFEGSRPLSGLLLVLGVAFELVFWIRLLTTRSG